MKDKVQIEMPDLFNLVEPIDQRILKIISKTKRTTSSLIAKELKCPNTTALWNLERLTSLGLIKNLGKFKINGRYTRVYEI